MSLSVGLRVPRARFTLYAATAAVLAMTGRAVLVGPPPMWIAALAFVAYSGLVLAGVFVIELRVFADAVVRGPEGARGVALTFDDGPDPASTIRVLDLLDDRGHDPAEPVKATFFVIARKAKEHPEIVREILARGHSVGLHSFAHDRLFSLRNEARVRADLEEGIAVLTEITGTRPTLFRPPIGHTNPIIARVAEALDLTIVGWSVSGRDGLRSADPARVAARIAEGLRDGAIVLMHDAAERQDFDPAGPRALDAVLSEVRRRDLAVVPLAPWVEAVESAG